MEFWGIEVKPGSPVKVEVEDGYLIHISQATLGDSSKVTEENIPVYVKVGEEAKDKLVIGNLSKKIPQVCSLDLIFEQDFELSHDCKSCSVFLLGYRAPDVEPMEDDFDSEEDDVPTGCC